MKLAFWRKEQKPLEIENSTEASDLYDLLTGGAVANTGKSINEQSAMAVSAYNACVRLISGTIASLPLPIYTKDGQGNRVKEDNPISEFLNVRPCAAFSAAAFWEYMGKSLMLSGDGFALIVRSRGGQVLGLSPLHPEQVVVHQVKDDLRYSVLVKGQDALAIQSSDMLHFPSLGFDGKRSLNPIKHYVKEALGLAVATEEFSAKFFSNGARPDFALTTTAKLDDDQVKQLRETWALRHSGTGNAHLPAVLSGGLDVKQLTMSAEDSQLLEGRRFQVEEVARMCGVPPHMIGETTKTSSWGSGVEHMSIGFVKYALRHHLNRIEQELNYKLFTKSSSFVEFNVEGLLRGDSTARSSYYQSALGGSGGSGWMTINEVRKLENLPPISGGDTITQWELKNEKSTNSATGE